MRSALRLILLLALWPLAAVAQSDPQAVPALERRVTDLADILPPAAEAALEQSLADFEARKGSQIAVLTLPSTAPETIEQYAIRVVDAWKLGRKGVDDGALLLVAVEDRTLRIEVGRGLEGALTDLASNRIIDEIITPLFRAGDYPGGIAAGVQRMIGVIDGEPLPEPQQAWKDDGSTGLGDFFGLLFLAALITGSVLRALFGRLFGALATGGVIGFAGFMLSGAIGFALLSGILGLVVGAVAGLSPGSFGAPGAGRGRGSWRHGGWGGGSGGGFGGFGGGGGGFGGGGASGRW